MPPFEIRSIRPTPTPFLILRLKYGGTILSISYSSYPIPTILFLEQIGVHPYLPTFLTISISRVNTWPSTPYQAIQNWTLLFPLAPPRDQCRSSAALSLMLRPLPTNTSTYYRYDPKYKYSIITRQELYPPGIVHTYPSNSPTSIKQSINTTSLQHLILNSPSSNPPLN